MRRERQHECRKRHDGSDSECDSKQQRVPPSPPSSPFPVGSRVVHRTWGEGEVMRDDGAAIVVLFDTVGYRTLDTRLVSEEEILADMQG